MARKKRRKKAAKKHSGSAKAKLTQVIKTLHGIKKSC
jgi:hypothetical protein